MDGDRLIDCVACWFNSRLDQLTNSLSNAKNRYLSLDVIRGFAVMGMIFINVLVFVPNINAIIWHDYLTGETTSNGFLYKVVSILFSGKMRALFALLFGVGIVVFFQSKSNKLIGASDLFSRRMLFLLIFGLIHAYVLLWPGSILFEYAICGLVLFTLRGVNTKVLLALSCLVLGFYSYLNMKDSKGAHELFIAYEQAQELENAGQDVSEGLRLKKDQFQKILERYPPLSASKKEELETTRSEKIELFNSGLINISSQNVQQANEALSFGVYLNILESLGTMLLGMALFKSGFFEFRLKKYVYFFLILIGIPLGILLGSLVYEWHGHTQSEILSIYSWKNFSTFGIDQFARITLCLGYSALFVCLCRVHFLKPVLSLVGNVGRMAFTNYVTQTVICVLFFYVLGYYGSLSYVGLSVFSMGVILLQIIISYFSITFFQTGPIEYLWRKLARRSFTGQQTDD